MRFALVGDSQACATRYRAREVAKRDGVVISEDCVGGTQTRIWGPKLLADLPAMAPDVVMVLLGSNDGPTPDPGPVLDAIEHVGARAVWVGPPLIRGQDVNSGWIRSHVEARGHVFFDTQALHLAQDAPQVHPANAGEAARWFDAFYAVANQPAPGTLAASGGIGGMVLLAAGLVGVWMLARHLRWL